MFRTEGGRTIKLFLFFRALPSLCARTSRLFSPFFVDLSSQFHTESNKPSIFGQFGHSAQLQQTALYWIRGTSHAAGGCKTTIAQPRLSEDISKREF